LFLFTLLSLLPFPKRQGLSSSLDISQLYKSYGALVMRRAIRFFGEEEAWDVAHEVFLKVVEKQESFRAESAPSTWLYQLTTRHCINRLRNQRRREAARQLQGEQPWSCSGRADQETTLFLQELWQSLKGEQAQIGIYYFLDGMTQAEIGRIMGMARRTVADRIKSLQAQLRSVAAGES